MMLADVGFENTSGILGKKNIVIGLMTSRIEEINQHSLIFNPKCDNFRSKVEFLPDSL